MRIHRFRNIAVGNRHLDQSEDVIQIKLDSRRERFRDLPDRKLASVRRAALVDVGADLLLQNLAQRAALVGDMKLGSDFEIPEIGRSGTFLLVARLALLAVAQHVLHYISRFIHVLLHVLLFSNETNETHVGSLFAHVYQLAFEQRVGVRPKLV